MKHRMMKGLAAVGMLAALPRAAWAHASTSFHVHSDEVAGLVIVSLIVVGMLALAGKRER